MRFKLVKCSICGKEETRGVKAIYCKSCSEKKIIERKHLYPIKYADSIRRWSKEHPNYTKEYWKRKKQDQNYMKKVSKRRKVYYLKNKERLTEKSRKYNRENRKRLTAKSHRLTIEEYNKITSKCCICGFTEVVDLHHIDEDKNNKSKFNLVGLCPNHHQMIHRRHFTFDDLKKKYCLE